MSAEGDLRRQGFAARGLRKLRGARPIGLLTLALVVLAWWLVDRYSDIPPFKLPSIGSVAASLRELASSGELFDAMWASLRRLALGFLIGSTLGIIVGIVLASSRLVMEFVRPLVVFFQVIAGIAWIPLAIVWFGLGSGPVIFVVANAVFFIVLFNMLAGIQSIPQVLISSTKTLGAGRLQVIREVVLPGALTHLLVGLELSMGLAWRALVAAELIVATDGLGFITLQASTRFDAATVVAGIIVIGATWLVMHRLLLVPLQARTVQRWGMTRSVTD